MVSLEANERSKPLWRDCFVKVLVRERHGDVLPTSQLHVSVCQLGAEDVVLPLTAAARFTEAAPLARKRQAVHKASRARRQGKAKYE